jgi:hypothetical protein
MSGTPDEAAARFTIGAEVASADGPLGTLRWVVVDPVACRLTHVVVEPARRFGPPRLVPVDLADAGADGIRLRCGEEEFGRLETAEDAHFLPGTAGSVAWPYFGLGAADLGAAAVPQPVVYDRVPLGEVHVRRGDRVAATDGMVGSVRGLVVDPADRHVTHVLLQAGHLWGAKQVAIPVTSVGERDDGGALRVSLSKQQIRDLPPVPVEG